MSKDPLTNNEILNVNDALDSFLINDNMSRQNITWLKL